MDTILNSENYHSLERIFFKQLIARINDYEIAKDLDNKIPIFISEVILEDITISINAFLVEVKSIFGENFYNSINKKYNTYIESCFSNLEIELSKFDEKILNITKDFENEKEEDSEAILGEGTVAGNFVINAASPIDSKTKLMKYDYYSNRERYSFSNQLKSIALGTAINLIGNSVNTEDLKKKYEKRLTRRVNEIIGVIQDFYYDNIFNELYNILLENKLVFNSLDLNKIKKLNFIIDIEKSNKDFVLTLILAIFLPTLHRFYTGKIITGFIFLFTLGGFGLWYILDIIKILRCRFKDSKGKYIKR